LISENKFLEKEFTMYKRSQIENSTPLVRWLMEYSTEHEITLTELSRKANLSAGSLRSLVKYPERIPALETCVKLARITGKPAEEILQMAGLDGYESSEKLDPDRLMLLQIYQRLPIPMRRTLMKIAQAIELSQ
jgi:hypothetical protein